MPSELKPFTRRRPTGVVTGITGIGTERATRAALEMVTTSELERVIMIGVAGGLKGTSIGDVIVPEKVIDRASGREVHPEPIGGHVGRGVLSTGEFTTDAALMRDLEAHGVVAVDMETAAVGMVCEDHGVPWSVFRAISDRPGDRMVDDDVFRLANPDGSPNMAAVARYVLRKPWRVPTLMRLGRDLNTATAAAANAAIAAIADA